jgi:hypothetical protein
MERIATGSLESSPERAYSCYSVCSTSCDNQELRDELQCYDRHILLAVDGTVVSEHWLLQGSWHTCPAGSE